MYLRTDILSTKTNDDGDDHDNHCDAFDDDQDDDHDDDHNDDDYYYFCYCYSIFLLSNWSE